MKHIVLFALVGLACSQRLAATEITYATDPEGRRIEKRIDGQRAKAWLWSDSLRPIVELDANNVVTARFVYAKGGNVPACMVQGTNTFRLLTDHRGSVRLVVHTQTGDIAQRLDYDEFGRVAVDTNPGFQPFGYAGGFYDLDSSMVRFGARDYDVEAGRWLEKDPILINSGTANFYEYAFSNPVGYADRNGLSPDEATVSWGINADGNVGPFAGSAGVNINMDSTGFSVTYTGGQGPSLASGPLGVSGTAQAGYFPGMDKSGLVGPASQNSVSAGSGTLAGGVDRYYNQSGEPVGWGGNFGLGTPGVSYTRLKTDTVAIIPHVKTTIDPVVNALSPWFETDQSDLLVRRPRSCPTAAPMTVPVDPRLYRPRKIGG